MTAGITVREGQRTDSGNGDVGSGAGERGREEKLGSGGRVM